MILGGIREHLTDGTSEAVTRFTFGGGTTYLEREAYYAGQVVVGPLLETGWTLPGWFTPQRRRWLASSTR